MSTDFPINEIVHADCRHFRGDRPCAPHKREGVHCDGCPHYDPITRRILIIKLGAVGDVIRTTPLLRVLRQPGVHITWLTEAPEVLPESWIDRSFRLSPTTLAYLLANEYDALYNLDKDDQAIALSTLINAPEKFGFTLIDGVCQPLGIKARAKWLTGLFDDLNGINALSYPQEIFSICGLKFQGEKYLLELDDTQPFGLDLPRPLIGLNTGAGSRWPSRLWAFENWVDLISRLEAKGYSVLLLGGPDEDVKNHELAETTNASYLGTFSLRRFFHLVQEVNVLVTGVTMALHVGIALEKRIVLLNAIFNRREFELFNLGQIVEPEVDCLGCFKPFCKKDCMNLVKPDTVFKAVTQEIHKLKF